MKKEITRGLCVCIGVLLLLGVVTAGQEVSAAQKKVESKIQLEYKESKLYTKGEVKYKEASLEAFLTKIEESAGLDAQKGLEKLKETTPTRDNIELKNWGVFLYKYTGKTPAEYPMGVIEFETGGVQYTLKNTRVSREWLHDVLVPRVLKGVQRVSKNYPVKQYKVKVQSGAVLFKDFEVTDVDQIIGDFEEVYPLDDGDYIVYNTGVSYGIVLNKAYTQILRGYNGELPYVYKVESDVPASICTLSYITLPKVLAGPDWGNKTLQDMQIYKGLAVDLLTHELIDTNNLNQEAEKQEFLDYKIQEDKLIVLALSDTVVLVQPIFVECMRYADWDLNTGYQVDFTEIFLSQKTEVAIQNLLEEADPETELLDVYKTEDGFTVLGYGVRYPFLIYTNEKSLPYGRLFKRLYGEEGSTVMRKDELKELTTSIKADLKGQGRTGELNEYLKEAGIRYTRVHMLLLLFGCSGVFILFFKYKRKVGKKQGTPELLFEPEEYVEEEYVEEEEYVADCAENPEDIL